MGTLATVSLVGRAGTEVRVNTTQSGKTVASVSVAVDDPFKKDAEGRSETTWFKVSAWGNAAEFMENYISPGDYVAASGRLRLSTYTDKDGYEAKSLEVTADQITLVSKKGEGGGNHDGGGNGETPRRRPANPAQGQSRPSSTEDEYDPFADE